jgi:hypothetical protein
MNSLSRFLFSSVTLLTLSSIVSAISIRHDVSDTLYTEFANEFPNSSIGEVTDEFGGFSSGTYIGFGNGSHWVLTARHITTGNPIASVNFNGEAITALGQISHPGGNIFADDLGLIQIASAPTGIAPIRFTTQSNLIGERVIFGGYGLHGTGIHPGAQSYDGENRAAENIVDSNNIFGQSGYWATTFTNPGLGTALALEGTTAPGDSGGGMFWYDGTDWRLAGVTAIGTDQFSRYGDQTGFVALHNHIDWLEQNTGITAIIGVPEPTTIMLLGGFASFAILRRRRI